MPSHIGRTALKSGGDSPGLDSVIDAAVYAPALDIAFGE
jgi:6-phosphofructokinase